MRKYELTRSGNTEGPTAFAEVGPFTDTKSSLIALLDRRKILPAAYHHGLDRLLRLFIDWACDDKELSLAFVLSHPDLGIQNVLVSEDGRLAGLIDWDGVSFVPECIGNLRYPKWLTRDWDPLTYRYQAREDNSGEDFPADLAFYCVMYARCIEKHVVKEIGGTENGKNGGGKNRSDTGIWDNGDHSYEDGCEDECQEHGCGEEVECGVDDRSHENACSENRCDEKIDCGMGNRWDCKGSKENGSEKHGYKKTWRDTNWSNSEGSDTNVGDTNGYDMDESSTDRCKGRKDLR